MSVLDTFYFLFKADAKSVDQALDTAEKKAEDASHEIEKTSHAAEKLGDAFKDVIKELALWAAGFVAVEGLMEKATETASIYEASQALGMAVEDVDALGRAAEATGGEAQGMRDSLMDMAEKSGEALKDAESGAAKSFAGLKIGLKDSSGQAKNALQVMLDLADAVQGMSHSEAIFKIKELGITDNRAVEMVIKGRKAIEDMVREQKSYGVLTKENAEQAVKFRDALSGFKSTLGGVASDINSLILPAITWLFEGFQKGANWLRSNDKFVTGFFIAVAAVLTVAYLPAVIEAAVATWAMVAPLIAAALPLIALGVAFGLLYDDIMTYLEGGDSVIGQVIEWLNSFELLKAIINFVAAAFRLAAKEIVDFVSGSNVIQSLITGWTSAFHLLLTALKSVSDAFGWLIDKGSELAGIVAKFLGGKTAEMTATLNATTAGLNSVSGSPLAAHTSASISAGEAVTNTKNNNIKIDAVNVQTQATDAQGISLSIGGHLADQLKLAVASHDDGVAI